jgi:hypothetical protein
MASRKKDALASAESAPRSVQLADRGVQTGADFASLMSALLSDTIAGRIDPRVSNAACNISGKLLKVVELQFKFGRKVEGTEARLLELTPIAPAQTPPLSARGG